MPKTDTLTTCEGRILDDAASNPELRVYDRAPPRSPRHGADFAVFAQVRQRLVKAGRLSPEGFMTKDGFEALNTWRRDNGRRPIELAVGA